ncbi:MAG: carbon-nitrogen hydrolase [bacterium]|nr:carbon-nitrogen hydrolase [bacterium]
MTTEQHTHSNYPLEDFQIALLQHQSPKFSVTCQNQLSDEELFSLRNQGLSQAEQAISNAAKAGAQIICLAELFASHYFCQELDHRYFKLAESLTGETISRMSQAARQSKVVLIVPFYEERAPGVYHNSAAVIDTDGTIAGVQRKAHIPDDPQFQEKFYFTPADALADGGTYAPISTSIARIGVLICWDQWYPEAARLCALQGAEIIFYPTAIGWIQGETGDEAESYRQAWQTVQQGHAIANGCYIAAANRCGYEPLDENRGITFFGSSFISDPIGKKIAEASIENTETIFATCSRQKISAVRQTWPFLRDRRIDSYSGLDKRFITNNS